ncbi:MAG: hypothetical protein J7L88_00655, partial [Thermoplasmata archaeon]|nr:hypothetical protein [Thermoplasmata archaeon]
IHLYPIETTQLVSLAGVVLSGPLAIVGLILFSLPLVPKLEGKRWRWYLGGAGGVIAILSPLLFVSGVRTMGDLLSIRIKHAPDYISITAMPYVVLSIGLLMLAVVIWQGYSEHKRRDEAGEKSGKERSKAVFRKIE